MLSILRDQDKLLAQLTTVFGKTDVTIKSFEGYEELSKLFEYRVTFSAKDKALDLEKALGSSLNIAIKTESQERYIDGIVTEFSQGATEQENDIYVTEYTAIVRPKFWLLTLDKNCLIFQKKSAIDIIKKVLKDSGITDMEDKTRSCGKVERDYCVQYDESSFNFVSRLMEDEGIFYFFSHEKNKHSLILADAASAFKKCSGESKVEFLRSSYQAAPLGRVFNTSMKMAVNTGKYAHADYNYTISQTKLFSKLDTKWKGGTAYEYPGIFGKANDGDSLAKLRVQQFEFSHSAFCGSSTSANLTPGYTFSVTNHHVDKFNKEYTVFSVRHSFNFSSESGFIYSNDFNAFEKGIEFRPPRITPKPRIHGTQTAVVVCPSGEEIYRNEHCCVKVHFHWDQIGKKADANDSSCWIRVAQLLAGSGWGAIFVPRVGQEVVVAFLDGNPDRPLIVGCVYNDKYMPAYSDKEAMKSSLKTVTFKDKKGFNEFRFNDEKDKEEIFVHAQKDMYVDIIHSRKTEIEESDDTLDLFKGSRTITLKASGNKPGNHSLFLKKGDQIIKLTKGNRIVDLDEGDHKFTITKGGEIIKLGKGDRSVTLSKGNQTYDIKGDYSLTVSGNLTIKATGNIHIESSKKITMKSGQDTGVEAGTDMKLKASMNLKAEAGMDMVLKGGMNLKAEAGMEMKLKGGLNFKAEAGVGMDLKGGVTLKAEGGVSTKVAGAIVEVAGQGMSKVSGPMIMIGGGMVMLG